LIDEVRKTLPLHHHAQLFHVREVGGAQPAGMMLLREEHLARWTFGGPPLLHLALQRAQLAILKTPRMDPLQMLEYGLRLKPRAVLQQPANRFPDASERIRPRAPALRRL
jgi:hypothetical protein